MDATHTLLVILIASLVGAVVALVATIGREKPPPPPATTDAAFAQALVSALEVQADIVDKFMVQTSALLRLHMEPVVGGTPQTVELRKLELEAARTALLKAENDVRAQALALRFGHDGARHQPGPQPPG